MSNETLTNGTNTSQVNIFEHATRQKLRFITSKGLITVEDLWDLPLTDALGRANLDDLARHYHRALKDTAEESFVSPASGRDDTLQSQFDVVKHVIDVKVAERDKARAAAERRKNKARILELIENKKDEALGQKSIEELTEIAAAL
jgi:hypothetical protein